MRNILLAFCAITTLVTPLSFGGSNPAQESKPAEMAGLSVTLTLKTPAFGVDPQWPVFTVQFKNTSAADLTLYGPGAYWDWKIRFTGKKGFGCWLVHFEPIIERRLVGASTLKPGETIEVPIDLNQTPRVTDFVAEGTPAKLPPPPLQYLPAGHYDLTTDIKSGGRPSCARSNYWTGSLTTDPIDIQAQDADATFSAAIHRVTDKFDKFGLWTNGLFREINLPADAKLSDVITQAAKSVSEIKSYYVLDTRQIKVGASWDPACAAVLDTNAGLKVLILHPFGNHNGWWSRFYDATLAPATQPVTQAKSKG